MKISERLNRIKSELPDRVLLVAVSKTKSVDVIMEAYEAGQRVFGENRVQELIDKQPQLPKDIEWHHIGHLQTNKVKFIAPFVSLIHAVDSSRLLREINKHAINNNRIISCLLQVHIAEEETKFGLSESELLDLISEYISGDLSHLRICGLMGMATYTDDDEQVRKEFRFLRNLFESIKTKYKEELPDFSEVSMGMSGDYPLAIEEHSTMIRVGSSIFGSRH